MRLSKRFEPILNSITKQLKIDTLLGTENLSWHCAKPRTDFYTLGNLLPYQSYDEDYELFLNDNSVSFLLEIAPLAGITVREIDSLSNVFADLEEGIVMQVLMLGSPDIESYLNNWHDKRDGEIFRFLAKHRVEYLKNSHVEPLFPNKPFIHRDFRILISVSLALDSPNKYKQIATRVSTLRGKIESLIASLNSFSKRVDATGLISFMHTILRFNLPKVNASYNGINPIAKELSYPDQKIEVKEEYLVLNQDAYSSVFTVKKCPTSWSQNQNAELLGNFFKESKQISCPFLSSFSFKVVSQDNARAKAAYRMSRANSLAKSKLAEVIPSAKARAVDATFLFDKLEQGNKLIESTHHILLLSRHEKDIQTHSQDLKNVYIENGFDVVLEKEMQLVNFLACLPMIMGNGLINDFISLKKTRRQLSWTASNLIPLVADYKGNRDGIGMLLSSKKGQLFGWTPFNNTEGNFNCSIAGKPGSGKSFLMQELITSLAGSGCRVFIIDDGYSFEQTTKILSGNFVEFSSNKSKTCLNPFSSIDPERFRIDSDYRTSICGFLVNILCQMARGGEGIASEEERKDLEKAVDAVWQSKGTNAEVEDIITHLESGSERARNLSHLLHSFGRNGMYGQYFTGKSTLDLNHKLITFELSEVKTQKHLQKVVMLTIMFLISESIYRDGTDKNKKAIVIDEAWDLLGGGEMSLFIDGLVRRIRKYGGSVITGTQSINDYYKNRSSQSCYENSEWRILMAQKPESIELLRKDSKLPLSDSQESILKSITKSDNFSEFVISGPAGMFTVGRLICDPYSTTLYSSKKEHRDRKQELVATGIAVTKAIEIATEEFMPQLRKRKEPQRSASSAN